MFSYTIHFQSILIIFLQLCSSLHPAAFLQHSPPKSYKNSSTVLATSAHFILLLVKYALSENREVPHYVFYSTLLLPVQQYRKITKMAVQSAAVLLAVHNVKCGPSTGYPNALVVVFLSVSLRAHLDRPRISFVSRPFCVPYRTTAGR